MQIIVSVDINYLTALSLEIITAAQAVEAALQELHLPINNKEIIFYGNLPVIIYKGTNGRRSPEDAIWRPPWRGPGEARRQFIYKL